VLKARGLRPLGQEGTGSGRWTLLDFGAFVIHIFYHPVREFYDLESLWIEAPRVKLEVPPEATLAAARRALRRAVGFEDRRSAVGKLRDRASPRCAMTT
jgi:hypothetical protein